MASLIHSLQLQDTVATLDCSSAFVVAGCLNGSAYVWKLQDITLFPKDLFLQTLNVSMGVSDLKIDSIQSHLFVSTLDAKIRKYQLVPDSAIIEIPTQLMGNWKIDLNNEKLITACGDQGKVTTFSKSTGNKQQELKAGQCFLNCLYRCHNDKLLAVGNSEGALFLFNLSRNNKLARFNIHEDIVRDVKILEDKSHVITVSDDRTVKVFDANKEEVGLSFGQHSETVTCVDMHPQNENLFATGSLDNSVRIWDTRQKTPALSIAGSSPIWSLRYWNTGNALVSGCEDGSLKIYSL